MKKPALARRAAKLSTTIPPPHVPAELGKDVIAFDSGFAFPEVLPDLTSFAMAALTTHREESLQYAAGHGQRPLRTWIAGYMNGEGCKLSPDDILIEQGDSSDGPPLVYLVLDGVLEVVIDGEVVGELGPGAIVGERAQLEGGTRTATLRAKTAGKVVGIPGEELNREALEQVAAGHRREES